MPSNSSNYLFMLEKFQKNSRFLMLALDHRGSFKKYVNEADPESVTDDEITNLKKMIIDATYSDFSGLLVDPDWGLKAYEKKDKPYLLCIEETGYSESAGERITSLKYTVKELKDLGASGVKILLYFNPAADEACQKQLATAKLVLDQCKQNNLPLFLEIVTYGNEEVAKTRSEWVINSVNKFLEIGIFPDVFKLEYPGGDQSCKKITEMLGAIPWILLTRGEPYEIFVDQLESAVKNGARGFLAGRAIWQEVSKYDNDAGRMEFLNNIAKERFHEICQITL